MGMMFPLRYTNLVAYFTTDMQDLDCPLSDLRGFFEMLHGDEWRLLSSEADNIWPTRIRRLAEESMRVVDHYAQQPEVLATENLSDALGQARVEGRAVVIDEPDVSVSTVFSSRRDVLQDLHIAFRDTHDVFALGVARGPDDAIRVNEVLREALVRLRGSVPMLVLLPDPSSDSPLDFVRPFPGATDICRFPERWPGILLWNRFGNSLFLPVQTARASLQNAAFLRRFKESPFSPKALREVERGYVSPESAGRQVRILHLSDLHFGTKYAASSQDYLLSVIKDELRSRFDRVVITGDLFDSPWKKKWRAFESFRTSLRLIIDKDPIVVVGNHDSRIMGNRFWRFGESYRYLSELPTTLLVGDNALECLFFCFNSCKRGSFARGEVIEEDLARLATEYHIEAGRDPSLRDWLRIALVHHHPFEFKAAAEGMTARLLKAFHIPEGKLVDMNESERFVRWCADRGVHLILHGHRHVQRKITKAVPVPVLSGTDLVPVTAVGCGTSLGAEGIDKSYNLIQ